MSTRRALAWTSQRWGVDRMERLITALANGVR